MNKLITNFHKAYDRMRLPIAIVAIASVAALTYWFIMDRFIRLITSH